MASEDALIQVAVHLSIDHQMSRNALRSLVDLALLVQRQPVAWAVAIQRTHTWRVATVIGLALALTQACFDFPELAAPVAALAPPVPATPGLARSELSLGNARFAYRLTVTDHRRDSLHLLWRTLWPEQQLLQVAMVGPGWAYACATSSAPRAGGSDGHGRDLSP